MKTSKWIQLTGILFIGILFSAVSAQAAMGSFSFDDIDYWVGTGANEAAFVIDWHDDDNAGPMVWGYRWDGEASGEDMLMAIVNNDSNLYAKVSGPTQYGIAVFGLGYDVDSDGFGISDGSLFTNGITQAGYSTADGSSATDPDDLYTEGWYQNGYWSYWLADGTDWGYSGTGMSGRTLSDGDVDGWGFSFYGGGGGAPSITPAPVPVPAAFWLLGSGIIGLAGLKRRN